MVLELVGWLPNTELVAADVTVGEAAAEVAWPPKADVPVEDFRPANTDVVAVDACCPPAPVAGEVGCPPDAAAEVVEVGCQIKVWYW